MTLAEILAQTQAQAEQVGTQVLVQAQGTSAINAQGELVTPLSTATLSQQVFDYLRAVIGQATPAPRQYWRMSNNSLSNRADALEAFVATVPELIADAVGSAQAAVLAEMQLMRAEFGQSLAFQSQAFLTALQQQRTELHNEILGSAAPLLATIQQLQALDKQHAGEEAGVHHQLFTLLGQQAQQLQQAQQALGLVQQVQATTDAALGPVQAAVADHARRLGVVEPAVATLQTTVATQGQQLATTTATANAAQQQATQNAAGLATLADAVAGQGRAIVALTTSSTTQGQQLTGLAATVQNQAGTLATLSTALASEDSKVAGIAGTVQQQGTQLSSLADTVGGQGTRLGKAEATIADHTAALGKRLRTDQADATSYNLGAAKATAAGQVVVYEQLGERTRTAHVQVAAAVLSVGNAIIATITWATPFPDANYAVGAPLASNASLLSSQWYLTAQTKDGCTLTLKNTTLASLTLTAGTLHVTATRD